jgi:hypothetical protein
VQQKNDEWPRLQNSLRHAGPWEQIVDALQGMIIFEAALNAAASTDDDGNLTFINCVGGRDKSGGELRGHGCWDDAEGRRSC